MSLIEVVPVSQLLPTSHPERQSADASQLMSDQRSLCVTAAQLATRGYTALFEQTGLSAYPGDSILDVGQAHQSSGLKLQGTETTLPGVRSRLGVVPLCMRVGGDTLVTFWYLDSTLTEEQ